MKGRYLEITYRNGKLLAAYLYLTRQPHDCSARCEEAERGLVIDYADDGRPIGIEITSPSNLTLEIFNRTLSTIHQEPVTSEEIAPLLAA
jgi:uncharacterized protein YuzE